MRLGVLSSIIGGMVLSNGAVAQEKVAFDPLAVVGSDFDRIASMVPAPAPTLVVTDAVERDGAVADGTVTLSNRSIAEAHSQAELDGLLAFLVAKAAEQSKTVGSPKMASVPSMVAAGVAIAAGERLDRRDEGTVPVESRRNYEWNPSAGSKPSEAGPGRTALVLMQRADSCSGAALAYMDRLAVLKGEQARAPVHRLAQEAVQEFGMLAAPPDMSCVADE